MCEREAARVHMHIYTLCPRYVRTGLSVSGTWNETPPEGRGHGLPLDLQQLPTPRALSRFRGEGTPTCTGSGGS